MTGPPNPGGAPTSTEPGAIVFLPPPDLKGFDEDEIYTLFSSSGVTAATHVFHMPGHHDQLSHGSGGTFNERVTTAKKGKAAHGSVPRQYTMGVDDDDTDMAIGEYVIDGDDINADLRGGGSSYSATTDLVDGAMERSKLPEDAVVYRGVSSAQRTFGSAYRSSSMVGMEWTDRGYSSTTTNEVVADRFAGGSALGVRMRILAPAGTGAIAIDDYESEILLPRGLKFRVVNDVLPESGPRQLDVEIV